MSCIPAYAQPAIVEYLSQRKANGDEDAARLLGKLPTKGVKKTLDLPGRGPEQKAAAHRATTRALREFVEERSGGRCEVSGAELGAAWEMHHVQGKGERRSAQRPGNVLAVSWEVHRLIHRGDLETLRRVALAPTLDAQARREAQHRIDKLTEARSARSTPRSGGAP